MNDPTGYAAYALLVMVGSAVPFLPTGELVSGAAALADRSLRPALVVFLLGWAASLVGDTLLLLEVRLGRTRLQRWLGRRAFAERVQRAQAAVLQRGAQAIVVGRLVPGGRAPVVFALGLSQYPVRRFVLADAVACAAWAAIYTTIGAIGGRIAGQPVWGLVLAVVIAVALGGVVRVVRLRRPDAPQE